MSERLPRATIKEFSNPLIFRVGEHHMSRIASPDRLEYMYLGTGHVDRDNVSCHTLPHYLAYVTTRPGQSLAVGGPLTLHTNLSSEKAALVPQDAVDQYDFLAAAYSSLVRPQPYSYYQERFAARDEEEFESRIAQVADRALLLGFDSRAPIVAQMPVYQGGTIVGLEGAACFPNSFPQD